MSFITLKTSTGHFVRADVNQDGKLVATDEAPHLFDLTNLGSGRILLQPLNMDGQYVAAKDGGDDLLTYKPKVHGWKEFTIEHQEGDFVALRASTGKYLVNDEEGSINATSTSIGASETFLMTRNDDLKKELQGRRGISDGPLDSEEGNVEWNDETHRKMVDVTINLLKPHHLINDNVRHFIRFANVPEFTSGLYQGLHDADYKSEFTGLWWEYHFYDPDTGLNYRGGKRSAYTEGVRYFNTSIASAGKIINKLNHNLPVLPSEWRECGYYLGVSSHYLTDLTQSMHAANFANVFANNYPIGDRYPLPNILDKRHSDFEGVAEDIVKDGYLDNLSPLIPKDLDIGGIAGPNDFLLNVARDSKSFFSKTVKPILDGLLIPQSFPLPHTFKKWTEEQVLTVLDGSMKPKAVQAMAKFYLLWIQAAKRRGLGADSDPLQAVWDAQREGVSFLIRGADSQAHYCYQVNDQWQVDSNTFRNRLNGMNIREALALSYNSSASHPEALVRAGYPNGGYLYYFSCRGARWDFRFISSGANDHNVGMSLVHRDGILEPEIVANTEEGTLGLYTHKGHYWDVDKLSFLDAGKIEGRVQAVYNKKRGATDIFVRDEEGFLRLFYFQSGAWHQDKVSLRRIGPCDGLISSLYNPTREHTEVFARGADGHLSYLYVSEGSWRYDNRSFRAAGVISNVLSAVYVDWTERNHPEVFARGEDGFLHYFYVRDGQWAHDGQSFRNAGQIESASAVAPPGKHVEVIVRGEDGKVSYFKVVNRKWVRVIVEHPLVLSELT